MTRYRCALVTLGLVVMAGIVTWAVLNAPKSAGSVAITIPATEPAVAPSATDALHPDFADKIVALGRMSPPPAPKYWIAWLAIVWMLGAAVMLLRAGIKVAGAENLRRSCQPLNDERVLGLVAEARRAVGLARQIRVAVTDKLTSPAVVGVIVPTLILPLSLFTALTPEQIRFILLHELAHIRRGDYFANLFQLFAEALLFFNPALWWISLQIRREREACCDALAIELSGAPADYVRTLVRVAENILRPATSAALAFGDGQREPSSLADRVQRVLVPGFRPALRLTWRAMLASLLVGGMLLFLSAVGARNVVGAVTSNARETAPKQSGDRNSTNPNLQPTSNLVVPSTIVSQRTMFASQAWGQGRRAMSNRLEQIKFDKVIFQKLPLFEVVRILNDEARKRDPDRTGINFIIDPNVPGGTNQISLTNCPTISMDKEVIGVTLRETLDSIVKGASAKIHYSIEDYAVIFGLGEPIEPLYMRAFKIDLNLFFATLGAPDYESRTDDSKAAADPAIETRPNGAAGLLELLRKRLRKGGVDLDRHGVVTFLNERSGTLLVWATIKDLNLIESQLAAFCSPPPGINIKVQWVEISSLLTNSMLRKFQTNALPPEISRTLSLSGILTETQMAEVREHINFRDGFALLSEGDITTQSDRQAQIQTFELTTIVTGINPKALTSPGVNSETNTFETQGIPFGPILDVLPTVSGVDAKISLRVVATLNEFLGYEKGKSNVPIYVNGHKEETTLPLPKIRVHQLTNDCVIPNGQTLVLGNLPTTEIAKQPNGEFLTTDVTGNNTKFLFVFVTPTIVDPAGNRVNPIEKSLPSSPPTSK